MGDVGHQRIQQDLSYSSCVLRRDPSYDSGFNGKDLKDNLLTWRDMFLQQHYMRSSFAAKYARPASAIWSSLAFPRASGRQASMLPSAPFQSLPMMRHCSQQDCSTRLSWEKSSAVTDTLELDSLPLLYSLPNSVVHLRRGSLSYLSPTVLHSRSLYTQGRHYVLVVQVAFSILAQVTWDVNG